MRFMLGRIVATPGAMEILERRDDLDPAKILYRHVSGDWGNLDASDRRVNDRAIDAGERILSEYGDNKDGRDDRLWVITEADRRMTTILRPDDY